MRWGRNSIVAALLAAALAVLIPSGDGSSATGAPPGRSRARDCHTHAPPILHDGFPEPPARYSAKGVLDTTLHASLGKVMIDHRRVTALSYDGSFPGPTLVICAGDRLRVRLVNDLSEPTNLHTHGFHVSPQDNHDNVFVTVEPHKSFDYEYEIPHDMPAGSYWYHPHLHMLVEPQIFGGLAGAIVEEGGLDDVPSLRHVAQRWIVIENTQVRGARVIPAREASEAGAKLYVNGTIDPTAKIRPGQLQRWRIFNADADRFVALRLPHGQSFRLLAEDGHTLARARTVRTLLMAPASRREVLVRGGRTGAYPLRAIPFSQFPGADKQVDGGPVPNETLLTLRSAGRPARVRFAARTRLSAPLDLRRKHVDRRRTIAFGEMSEPSGATRFELNGMTFDAGRTDVTMKLGSVEQWTLVNETSEWHTFHMHINDFQVVNLAGRPVPYVEHVDNLALPPRSKSEILLQPTDFIGRFVFHCHVTLHEDRGMMATVQVVREPTAAQARRTVVRDGGLRIGSAAYGSSAPAPSVRALLFFCRALGIAPPPRGRGY
jgi:suppressor of ftsI